MGSHRGLVSIDLKGTEEEVNFVKNVEEDVRKMKANLEAIQAVLEDAEEKQLSDLNMKNWLDKLRDTSFDVKNTLDELITAILQLKINEVGEDVPIDISQRRLLFY